MNKSVSEAIKDRRSVRKYKDEEIDAEKVKKYDFVFYFIVGYLNYLFM